MEVRLSDFANIYSGFAFPTAQLGSFGLPVLKIGNISDGKLDLNCDSFYSLDPSKLESKFLLKETDTLVCMTGATIGKAGRVFDLTGKKYLVNQRVAIVRPTNSINSDFVYLICTSKPFKKYVEQIGNGAAQANISAYDIGNFKFDFNSSKINEFTKSLIYYDQLIENNNKRIKLLEEMAQELYKEWFVRFRFPGYENVEFENAIPKGREYKSFKEAFGGFVRGKNITSSEMIEGEIPVISAGLQPSGYHNKALVNKPCITVSGSGANAGYLSFHYKPVWCADCSYFDKQDNLFFIYTLLDCSRPIITGLQHGAAQPHVYPKDIDRIKVLVPNKDLLNIANKKLKTIYEQVSLHKKINENLKRQRDFLLPRLMSGQLSLDGKEIV